MADEKQSMDSDLADSIEMLERILEVMPQDIMALKALYSAYNQGGFPDRAFEYLCQLSNVVCEESNVEVGGFVAKHMPEFAEKHPTEVAAQLAQIRALTSPEPEVAAPSPRIRVADVDISEELALAWKLYEENQLSQEEYSSILSDLTEISSKELDVPISVLHVLNDRGFNQMNRIMNYMSSRSGVPCISLLNFELPEKVGSVLPMDVATHDGALPFGFFGDDLLVAVLNPFNNMLMDKVEKFSGHRCHAYLVAPADYDAALGKLHSMDAKAA